MSFVIFVPDFVDEKSTESENECNWLKRLENSRWKRKKIVVPIFEHEFRHGGQHMVQKYVYISITILFLG
jgi:phosphorylated CTD-interacting factor 1